MMSSAALSINTAHYQHILATCQAVTPVPTIIAVTKYGDAGLIRQCVAAGITDIAENRVAEALDKQAAFGENAKALRWHLIGHVQTNKVAKTIGKFHLIHSVDSVRLAETLSQANALANHTQRILLQVNIAEEPQKHGFTVTDINDAFPHLIQLPSLQIEGLMTMAPNGADETELNRVFGGLATLRDQLQQQWEHALPELSMGMSNDYPIALQHGATLLRLGRVLYQ